MVSVWTYRHIRDVLLSLVYDKRMVDARWICPNEEAGKGHMRAVKWLHEHASRHSGFCTDAMDDAAANGHLEVVKYIHAHREEGCSTWAVCGAAENGHSDVVSWFYRNHLGWCHRWTTEKVAQNGHLEVMKCIHKYGVEECTTGVMDMAAANGHLDVVQWLHENCSGGCTMDAMDAAAWHGDLDMVKWLYDHRTEVRSIATIFCEDGVTYRGTDHVTCRGRYRRVSRLHYGCKEGCGVHAMDLRSMKRLLGLESEVSVCSSNVRNVLNSVTNWWKQNM